MDFYDWSEKKYFQCRGNYDKFCSSVNTWISKPHCLNKKIGGVDKLDLGILSYDEIQLFMQHFPSLLFSLTNPINLENTVKKWIDDFFRNHFESNSKSNEELKFQYKVILRFVYPKSGEFFPENAELIIKDDRNYSVIFNKPMVESRKELTITSPYAITFENEDTISVSTLGTSDDNVLWLFKTLLPKLVCWVENDHNACSLDSNRLVSTNKYLLTYTNLKKKYFNAISEFWNESTNPEKFITEDIAIASYLIVLWGEKSQTFVDLGCGNGLLVYILENEGHHGYGIDVRARKIWSAYPSSVILKEETIVPSFDCIFPKTDWLIGNHSDELSPWIPIMATNSSYSTNFFLLPCCPFELNGQKFIRNDTSKSSYSDYMDYLESVCNICGFEIEKDRLKIPSTKRICLVTRKRDYSLHDYLNQKERIKNLVKLSTENTGKYNIKLRSSEEKVRNCTQLNKQCVESIVLDIANFIINSSDNKITWREGQFIDLTKLITLLSTERRQFLKSQCGGLQTLLKNHHHVFLVYRGKVKLRKPALKNPPPKIIKKNKCWFFFNHPDSCPLIDDMCTYKHSD